MNQNPLSNFFRTTKYYVTLPSGGNFYDDGVIDLNESNEVGIKAMTAKDEILFKNPEAILNGDALINAIMSCVDGIKDPKKLLVNDLNALFVAIRHATYGDKLELSNECPKCKHENMYTLNTESTLDSMEFLEDSYQYQSDNGLKFQLHPFTYETQQTITKISLEQARILRNLDSNDVTDDVKINELANSFKNMAETNYELIASAITSISHDTLQHAITDFSTILDYLKNSERKIVNDLDNLIKHINSIGIPQTYAATCEKCEHVWDAKINFDPTSFFSES